MQGRIKLAEFLQKLIPLWTQRSSPSWASRRFFPSAKRSRTVTPALNPPDARRWGDESDYEDGADNEPSLGWGVDGETGNESGADRELAAQPSASSLEKARKRYNHNSICNVMPIPGASGRTQND
jgi:hypothetical protein